LSDKVRFLGEEAGGVMTAGKIYEVVPVSFGAHEFRTTTDSGGTCGWFTEDFCDFHMVDEAPQPGVTDLIANLGRRVHEVETALATEREYHQSCYVKISDLRDQNDQQAYEINELYRSIVRMEARL